MPDPQQGSAAADDHKPIRDDANHSAGGNIGAPVYSTGSAFESVRSGSGEQHGDGGESGEDAGGDGE